MPARSSSQSRLRVDLDNPALLADSFRAVRRTSAVVCEPLEIEDYVIQAMDDVSPPRWHLAHVTWFFETFILKEFLTGYRLFNEHYPFLFNSYYEHAGARWTRADRGLLSRPTVREIYDFRDYVDEHMLRLLDGRDALPAALRREVERRTVLGLHHEQQHQELLFMDIKYNLSINPLFPAYRDAEEPESEPDSAGAERAGPAAPRFLPFQAGLVAAGRDAPGPGEFCFDNETPRHQTYLHDFELADRLVTNGEYLEFIEDGGYGDFRHWLSDGWACVQSAHWQAPLYWQRFDDEWYEFTLNGLRLLDPAQPVCHVSFFEAEAYARWASARLPTEFEWEHAAGGLELASAVDRANLLDEGRGLLQPAAAGAGFAGPGQMFGDVWEWTVSAYLAYPGFSPLPGALGEYNGKFMNDQRVLRGGCCVTERTHIRPTYRNFFQSDKRWAVSGFRLAR